MTSFSPNATILFDFEHKPWPYVLIYQDPSLWNISAEVITSNHIRNFADVTLVPNQTDNVSYYQISWPYVNNWTNLSLSISVCASSPPPPPPVDCVYGKHVYYVDSVYNREYQMVMLIMVAFAAVWWFLCMASGCFFYWRRYYYGQDGVRCVYRVAPHECDNGEI